MARLEVITGPMFSGKSEELVRRMGRSAWANRNILLVKPSSENRNTRNIFNLIEGDKARGIEANKKLKEYDRLAKRSLEHPKELGRLVDSFKPALLVIDEIQFFGREILEYLEELLEKMKGKNFTIIAAGLDMDAWRRPFGIMPQLLAMADEVLKLTAVCLVCQGENGPAIFTQKKGGTGKQVEVGDTELYEARCRVCHTLPKEDSA